MISRMFFAVFVVGVCASAASAKQSGTSGTEIFFASLEDGWPEMRSLATRREAMRKIPAKNSSEWNRMISSPPLGQWSSVPNHFGRFMVVQELPISPLNVESGIHTVSFMCLKSRLGVVLESDKAVKPYIWLEGAGDAKKLVGSTGRFRDAPVLVLAGRPAATLLRELLKSEKEANKLGLTEARRELAVEANVSGPQLDAVGLSALFKEKLPDCAKGI